MICAQHGPEVEQSRGGLPVGVDESSMLSSAQAQSRGIGRCQPGVKEVAQQDISRVFKTPIRTAAVNDSIDQQFLRIESASCTPQCGNSIAVGTQLLNAAGAYLQLPTASQ
jgi:hypothetical protein